MELITHWMLLGHVLLVRLFLGVVHGSVVSLLADDRCPVLLYSCMGVIQMRCVPWVSSQELYMLQNVGGLARVATL